MARRKIFRRWVRHPVTRKQFRLSAPTPGLLAQLHEEIEVLRHKLLRDVDGTGRTRMTALEVSDRIRAIRGKRTPTLAEAAAAYAARESLAENTAKGVSSLIRTHAAKLSALPLTALDVNTLKVWVDYLRGRQVAVSSILCYWRRLRAIVTFAIEREWIGALPWGDFRPKLVGRDRKEREACRSYDELERLLLAARELDRREECRRHLEAKIATAIALGLRQGELAGLRWSDVIEREGVVVIARQYAGALTKTRHRPKRLEVPRELFAILAEHRARLVLADLYAPSGPVFPAPHRSVAGEPRHYTRGECLTTRSLRAVVRLSALPNENAWSSHSLRDTFATLESLGHGGDIATVAQRTRHKSLSALARYLRAVRRDSPSPGFSLPAPHGGGPVALLGPSDDEKPTK